MHWRQCPIARLQVSLHERSVTPAARSRRAVAPPVVYCAQRCSRFVLTFPTVVYTHCFCMRVSCIRHCTAACYRTQERMAYFWKYALLCCALLSMWQRCQQRGCRMNTPCRISGNTPCATCSFLYIVGSQPLLSVWQHYTQGGCRMNTPCRISGNTRATARRRAMHDNTPELRSSHTPSSPPSCSSAPFQRRQVRRTPAAKGRLVAPVQGHA